MPGTEWMTTVGPEDMRLFGLSEGAGVAAEMGAEEEGFGEFESPVVGDSDEEFESTDTERLAVFTLPPILKSLKIRLH